MNKSIAVVGGIVLGATVGAVAMVLAAPSSGKETRDAIQKRSKSIRNRLSRRSKRIVEEATA